MKVGENQLFNFLNNPSDLTKNRLYYLPYDILLFIFEIKEHEQVNLIINKWYWYLNKKIILVQKIISLTRRDDINNINFIDPFEIETVQVLYNSCNILSGREDIWWLQQLIYVINGLIIYSIFQTDRVYDMEPRYVDNFYKTEGLLEDLLVKFKIFQTQIEADNYYFNLYNIENDILQHINSIRLNQYFNLNDI